MLTKPREGEKKSGKENTELIKSNFFFTVTQ